MRTIIPVSVRDRLSARDHAVLPAVQPDRLLEAIRRSEELQARRWAHAAAVGRDEPGSIVVGLFISSLNEVIDLHAKRLALGLRSRIPLVIWMTLFFVSIVGTSLMGLHAGLIGPRRALAGTALTLAFSAVVMLIADLDRSREGFMQVSQQSLMELRTSIQTDNP